MLSRAHPSQLSFIFVVIVVLSGLTACFPRNTDCAGTDPNCNSLLAYIAYIVTCKNTDWLTFYGSETQTEFLEVIVQIADEGYIAAGRARGTFGNPVNAFDGAEGVRNVFAVKYDRDGTLVWNTFLGQAIDRTIGMVDAGDGVIIAAGSEVSFGSPLQSSQATTNMPDWVVLKLDYEGRLVWHTYIGSPNSEAAQGIVADGRGNYLIVGESSSDFTNGGTIVQANLNSPTQEFAAVLIDGNGNPQWQTHIGGPGTGGETARKAVHLSNGSFVIGGDGDASLSTDFNNERNAFAGGAGSNDYLLVSIDSGGQYQWHAFYGAGSQNDQLSDMVALSDDMILVTGGSNATWGNPRSAHPASGTVAAGTIFLLSDNGVLDYNTFYGTAVSTGSLPVALRLASAREAAIMGFSFGTFGTPLDPFAGTTDLYTAVFDPYVGTLSELNFYGGALTNEQNPSSGFTVACDGGYVITGAADGNFGQSQIVPYGGTGFQGFMRKISRYHPTAGDD